MAKVKLHKFPLSMRKPPKKIEIKGKVSILWSTDHATLVVYPRDWNSAVWMSRFHLGCEAMEKGDSDMTTAAMGPVGSPDSRGKYHEEDWPINMFDITLHPYNKPKKVKELLRLRNRKFPAEPQRKKKK